MTIDHIDKNANNAHDYEELDELLLESVTGGAPLGAFEMDSHEIRRIRYEGWIEFLKETHKVMK